VDTELTIVRVGPKHTDHECAATPDDEQVQVPTGMYSNMVTLADAEKELDRLLRTITALWT
jgi:hypothetical protein